MNRFFSSRPFAFVLAAVSVLTLAAPAQAAAARAHVSRGTAHFTSATSFAGEGFATHLGPYSEVGTILITPTADPTVLQVTATATYTGINGDELHAVFTGQLNGVTGVITATVTYVGGTGRFANATGAANLSGQLLADGTIEVTVKGTVNY